MLMFPKNNVGAAVVFTATISVADDDVTDAAQVVFRCCGWKCSQCKGGSKLWHMAGK